MIYNYVPIKVIYKVGIKYLLVQSISVLSIHQLLVIFLMICDLHGCSDLNVIMINNPRTLKLSRQSHFVFIKYYFWLLFLWLIKEYFDLDTL